MILDERNRTVKLAIATLCVGFAIALAAVSTNAQSTDQAFPTAITESQVTGIVKARDLGDPRVTTYYYTFNGLQGDLFVNVVTKNLSGSVDIFALDGMRTLSNIVVYADKAQSETGRVIYLRKPEKLLLRVQGRSPNDDPAEFQLKFAGGFEAATPTRDEPPVPKVTSLGDNDSGVKVNSVGTIVAVTPKPRPTPKPTSADAAKASANVESRSEPKDERKPAKSDGKELNKTADASVEAVSTDSKEPTNAPSQSLPTNRRSNRKKTDQVAKSEPSGARNTSSSDEKKASQAVNDKNRAAVNDASAKRDSAIKEAPVATANPLANVKLVILFKDGTKVERPMTEVFRFTADQTTLTVISKNGRVSKFSILEVTSVTIQ